MESETKLKFKIQFPPLFLHRLRRPTAGKKNLPHESKKKISGRCVACILYFISSIGSRDYQPLALVNPYHSFCYHFIRLGDGYCMIR